MILKMKRVQEKIRTEGERNTIPHFRSPSRGKLWTLHFYLTEYLQE